MNMYNVIWAAAHIPVTTSTTFAWAWKENFLVLTSSLVLLCVTPVQDIVLINCGVQILFNTSRTIVQSFRERPSFGIAKYSTCSGKTPDNKKFSQNIILQWEKPYRMTRKTFIFSKLFVQLL